MSSDSESSVESFDSSQSMDWEKSDISDGESRVVDSLIAPYQDEPLADYGDEESLSDKEANVDGLCPSTLEARYEGNVSVDAW